MKKGTKVCLVIALISFLLGIILIVAAVCIGGNPFAAIEEMGYNAVWDTSQLDEDFDEKFSKQDFELTEEFSVKEVNEIDLKIGIGAVVIRPVSADACRVLVQDSRNNRKIRSSVETSYDSGTLYIEDNRYRDEKAFWGFSLWPFRRNGIRSAVKVIIEVPKEYAGSVDADIQVGALKCYEMKGKEIDFLVDAGAIYGVDTQQADTINFTVNMGKMDFEDVRAKEAHVQADMGDLQINKARINNLEAQCDMGNLEISRLWADTLTVNCSMGDIDVEHADVTDLQAYCDMGSINLQMEGMPEDYFIISDVDMGDISIEDTNKTQDRNAPNTLELECNMGDIDVTFTNTKKGTDGSL